MHQSIIPELHREEYQSETPGYLKKENTKRGKMAATI